MTKTLLAVEDSKTMQRVLDIAFSGEEYEAVIAASPEQALERLDTLSPDMILLDVTLGNTDGYELCQQVKSRAPGIPVMMLSSRQQPYDAARGAAVQADDFIDKPFDTQQLRDKVDKLCASATPGARVVLPQTPVPGPPSRPAPAVAIPAAVAAPVPPPPVRSRPPVAAPRPAAAVASEAAVSNASAGFEQKLAQLSLSEEQVTAVLALSREVVEQVVWEVVPVLAETLIKEEIARLTRE